MLIGINVVSRQTSNKAIREASKKITWPFSAKKKAFRHRPYFIISKKTLTLWEILYSTFRFRFPRKHNQYDDLVIYMIWKILVVRKKMIDLEFSTFSVTFSSTILLICLQSHIFHRSYCQIFFHYTSLSLKKKGFLEKSVVLLFMLARKKISYSLSYCTKFFELYM